MAKKTLDLLALGILLISIFLFFFIIGIVHITTQIMGMIGCLITVIVEGYYLYKTWVR